MHLTDLLELAAELIPRRTRQVVVVAVALSLVVGFGRPAFNAAVTWFIETKSREITEDVAPIVEQMLTLPPTAP